MSGRWIPGLVFLIGLVGCSALARKDWRDGCRALSNRDFELAAEEFENVRRRRPKYAPIYLALAVAQSQQQEFEKAAENLTTYLVLSPDHTNARLYLGECLVHLGRYEEARIHLLSFVEEASHEEGAQWRRLAHAYHRLAQVADELQQPFEEQLFAGIARYYDAECMASAVFDQDPKRSVPVLDRADRILAGRRLDPEGTEAANSGEKTDPSREPTLEELLAEASQRLSEAAAINPFDDRLVRYQRYVDQARSAVGASDEILADAADKQSLR